MEVQNPIYIINYPLFYNGTIYESNNGGKFQVIDYVNKRKVRVKFLDKYGYEACVQTVDVLSGNVKNPYIPNKYGAYVGSGNYAPINNKKIYKAWQHMFERVAKDDPYSNVSICKDWNNYQIFAEWYSNYICLLNPNYDYEIDKDLYQWNIYNKIYSPQTCCLMPGRLNNSLVGLHVNRTVHPELPLGVMKSSKNRFTSNMQVDGKLYNFGSFIDPIEAFKIYKINKEKYIHDLATLFYNDNAILENVYILLSCIDIQPY